MGTDLHDHSSGRVAPIRTVRYTAIRAVTGPHMLVKAFIVFVQIAILASLGSALFYLVKDKGKTDRTVKALTLRIGLSMGLFLLLWLFYALGWIEPHGIYPQRPVATPESLP